MSVPVEPMANHIVVQAEQAANKTASGLYLPDNAKEKPKVAKVVAVGAQVEGIKVGDKVIYQNEYEATTVKVGGEEYTVVFGKNVIAKVSK